MEKQTSNGNGPSESTVMYVVILVVVILIALIIGVFMGYCLARKRKQSKQIRVVNNEVLNTKVSFEQLESEAE